MSFAKSSPARVHHNKSSNTPIHTIICTNSNTNSNKRSSFEAIIHHPRRLGSGSACERCRSRKTKCDGGQPCSFCASHGIQCVHRQNKKKRNSYPYATSTTSTTTASSTRASAGAAVATATPINGASRLDVNIQLPSLYRQHREPAEHLKQVNRQPSYFDKGTRQDPIKMSDNSSTDSSISSICSMHVPEEKLDKQIHAKSAALFANDPLPESWSPKSANIRMPSIMGKERDRSTKLTLYPK
ncbi:hypothetical protein FB192DRAFT_1374370 [Mucor lusitanicus]|uniref:Zn(2)-C6 fungal-type domain-containing protein n=1 Tax=Mucor circinelloides f. lusitanicus TaxID=29924 RepID=A0A8H4BHS1_MUCCL|nr:hypothetical protein FB192DRAFT_1374370 [Mucor lusitanicus]